MKKITKQELAEALGCAIGREVGMQGLNVLIHGWLRFRRYGTQYRHAIHARDWLYMTEVMELSDYAGCDLTKKSAQ